MVLCGLIAAGLAATGLAAAQPQTSDRQLVVGHSVRERAIVAYERGDPAAPATLVVGVIHGTEPAGLAVIRRLRHVPLPAGVHLWLVPTVNPDGLVAGTRQNAHGVDLNRNWLTAWVHNGRPWDGYYSGPRPMSEPENRAMRAFILRLRPALTIWYHQPLGLVYGSDPHVAALKRYARLTGLPYRRLVAPRGAATRWERVHFPRGAHFVVEFPAGRISTRTARRHAAAVLALAKGLRATSSRGREASSAPGGPGGTGLERCATRRPGLGGGVVLTSSLSGGKLTELHASGRRMWTKRVAPAARDAAFAVLP